MDEYNGIYDRNAPNVDNIQRVLYSSVKTESCVEHNHALIFLGRQIGKYAMNVSMYEHLEKNSVTTWKPPKPIYGVGQFNLADAIIEQNAKRIATNSLHGVNTFIQSLRESRAEDLSISEQEGERKLIKPIEQLNLRYHMTKSDLLHFLTRGITVGATARFKIKTEAIDKFNSPFELVEKMLIACVSMVRIRAAQSLTSMYPVTKQQKGFRENRYEAYLCVKVDGPKRENSGSYLCLRDVTEIDYSRTTVIKSCSSWKESQPRPHMYTSGGATLASIPILITDSEVVEHLNHREDGGIMVTRISSLPTTVGDLLDRIDFPRLSASGCKELFQSTRVSHNVRNDPVYMEYDKDFTFILYDSEEEMEDSLLNSSPYLEDSHAKLLKRYEALLVSQSVPEEKRVTVEHLKVQSIKATVRKRNNERAEVPDKAAEG